MSDPWSLGTCLTTAGSPWPDRQSTHVTVADINKISTEHLFFSLSRPCFNHNFYHRLNQQNILQMILLHQNEQFTKKITA
jgi:hypothetical protein